MQICKICLNSEINPSIVIRNGLCQVCLSYQSNYSSQSLIEEFGWLLRQNKQNPIMVGMSGGKDSTATADWLLHQKFNVIGFTFDIGYYPKHINSSAKDSVRILSSYRKKELPHEIIDIRNYITSEVRKSYIV